MISSGGEPATLLLVAQCLNQLSQRVVPNLNAHTWHIITADGKHALLSSQSCLKCFFDLLLEWSALCLYYCKRHHHHHHHVPEGLGMLSCSLILKMKLVPPSLPRSSYVPSSFCLYCSACFGSLFVSILCTCCSHFSWYCFISFTMFCAPVLCLIH